MKVTVELSELLELQARVVELEEEIFAVVVREDYLKMENEMLIAKNKVTITDTKGNIDKFPSDHTMD